MRSWLWLRPDSPPLRVRLTAAMGVLVGIILFQLGAIASEGSLYDRGRTLPQAAHGMEFDLPMMESIRLGASDVQHLRDAYLRTLVAPMDGMWEGTAIAGATFWGIRDGGRHAGYASIGADHALLRVHLAADSQSQAQDIFRWILSTHRIRRAIASTIEPPYLSLCLDAQDGLAIHSYLFRDASRVDPASDLGDCAFRRAERGEFEAIARFYRAQTDGAGEWIGAFVRERLDRGELFGLYEGHAVVATGECIPSRAQPPYADLGMVVARSHRGKGLGSALLVRLKGRCYEAGWRPICSCAAANGASKRAIEKAGFISDHRMVEIAFHERDATAPAAGGDRGP